MIGASELAQTAIPASTADRTGHWYAGFTTFCIKPNQFIDDPDGVGEFCREVMRRVEALTR